MTEYAVCSEADLDRGERVIADFDGREVAVFNVDGEYYAYPNWCPHQGGPLCEGSIDGTTEETFDRETLSSDLQWVKEDAVLRCPWHHWEFDIVENAFLHDEDRSLPPYDVRVEDGDVVLSL